MIHHKRTTGFTLIEAIAVVMLIGILMMVAQPIYRSTEEHFRKMTCLYNQRIINTAIEAWHAEKGTSEKPYPASVQGLVDDGYLQSLPKCMDYVFSAVDDEGHTECPKPVDKHVP